MPGACVQQRTVYTIAEMGLYWLLQKAVQDANDRGNEQKQRLALAKRDLATLEAEASSMEEAKSNVESEVAEAYELVLATSRKLEAAR